MERSKLCSVLIGLILCIFVSRTSQQACNHTLIGFGDTLYTLSDELVDADSAVSKCSALGGYMTMIGDETIKSSFVNASTEKYTKDLVRVWIFYKHLEKQFTGYFKSPKELGNWKSAKRLGHLHYVDLFSSQKETKRIPINFCYYLNGNERNKWRVLPAQPCDGTPWSPDFDLYGLGSETPGYKKVFIYQDAGPNGQTPSYSFRIFSRNEPNDVYEKYRGSFFVPDFNIFTGVRFNVSTSSWQWSNGSQAMFNNTGINTCQQQTMHYGEGWEVMNKSCKNQPAYYSCQSKFTISAHSLPCQSSRIIVTWKDSLLKFGGENMKVKIILTANGTDQEKMVPYSNLNYTFASALARVTYTAKALLYTMCNNVSVLATTSVTTGFGVPDDFSFARVSSHENCDVEVSPLMGPITAIHIYATSEANATVHTFAFNNNTHFTVPFNQHGSHNVTLKVQAATCEGHNKRISVLGYCQKKQEYGGTVQTPVIEKSPIEAIAGASGGLLVLVLLLAVFMIFRRKERNIKSQRPLAAIDVRIEVQMEERSHNINQENETSDPLHVVENHVERQSAAGQDAIYENILATESTVVQRVALCKDYALKIANGFQVFCEEFKNLNDKQQTVKRSHYVAHLESNRGRNRYKNICPFDESRVVLLHQTNDYINASYVAGHSQLKKFIATQGPKENTITDFWLMIWQQKSSIIVMLTKLRESGKNKCEKYWMDVGEKASFGSLTVQTTRESDLGRIVQRKFKISQVDGEQRVVTQFHYTSWPDHGIPATTSNMIYLRKMVEDIHDKQHPIIVHCSAGVGRTGTYIAMDILFDQLEMEGKIDVSSCVAKMRQSRKDMVQNVNQYVFIHKLVLEHDSMPDTDRSTDELQSISATKLSEIANDEFQQLSEWEFSTSTSTKSIRTDKKTSQKSLRSSKNTSIIEDLDCSKTFVVTKYPTRGPEQDLWKLAIKSGASTVLTLENDMENYTTWNIGKVIQLNDIAIQVENLEDCGDFVVHFLTVTSSTLEFEPSSLTHLHMKAWKEDTAPPSETVMINMINALLGMNQDERNGRVLCSCRTASRRSGTVIALMNILERLKILNKVDVFRTVKDLRDLRPNMVDNLVLYKYIYDVVLAYLASFDTYANYR